jgi:hypothetical protein
VNFKEWMMALDEYLIAAIGCGVKGFQDHAYWEDWRDGQTPEDTGDAVLASAGWAAEL